MVEVVLKMHVPKDLANELREVSKSDLSLAVNRLMREKLSRLIRLERIINKSKLSESKAREISDKIDESLAKRYDALYKEAFG